MGIMNMFKNNDKGEIKMIEEKKQFVREEITCKEDALKSLEGLHIKIYSRMKGKGLGIIEKLTKDEAELISNKELFISYLTSISSDISNTIKRALEYLK